jgi:hypothetical protein
MTQFYDVVIHWQDQTTSRGRGIGNNAAWQYFSISNGALKCRAGAKAQSFAAFDGTSELVP